MVEQLSKEFTQRFNSQPSLFVAPGRINLIGEHVDYSEGFVLPAAIDRQLIFAIDMSGTDRCNIRARDVNEGVSFSLRDLHPGEAPGLGVEIDESLAARHPYERAYLPVNRTEDGTVHSW